MCSLKCMLCCCYYMSIDTFGKVFLMSDKLVVFVNTMLFTYSISRLIRRLFMTGSNSFVTIMMIWKYTKEIYPFLNLVIATPGPSWPLNWSWLCFSWSVEGTSDHIFADQSIHPGGNFLFKCRVIRRPLLSQPNNNHNTNSKLHDRAEIEQNSEEKKIISLY